mgnify:CR=1 FL=1
MLPSLEPGFSDEGQSFRTGFPSGVRRGPGSTFVDVLLRKVSRCRRPARALVDVAVVVEPLIRVGNEDRPSATVDQLLHLHHQRFADVLESALILRDCHHSA